MLMTKQPYSIRICSDECQTCNLWVTKVNSNVINRQILA